MKSLKLVLIVAIIATAAVNYASPNRMGDFDPELKVIEISLENALLNPSLVILMKEHLDVNALEKEEGLIYFQVKDHDLLYVIYGTYEEWASFFGIIVIDENSVVSSGLRVRN